MYFPAAAAGILKFLIDSVKPYAYNNHVQKGSLRKQAERVLMHRPDNLIWIMPT